MQFIWPTKDSSYIAIIVWFNYSSESVDRTQVATWLYVARLCVGRRMKGSRRNKANIIIAQVIPVPAEETSEVFLTLTFLTRSLAIREDVMGVHFSLQLETRTAQTFYAHQPYQYTSPWPEETCFRLPSPWSIQSCTLLWWAVDTHFLPAKLRPTDGIHTSQTSCWAEAS